MKNKIIGIAMILLGAVSVPFLMDVTLAAVAVPAGIAILFDKEGLYE